MQKFSFTDSTNTLIRHNLEPEMLIHVIQNDEDEYEVFEDVYELFEYKGNTFVIKWLGTEEEIDSIDNFQHIRSILRRAWKWYKSQVHIEELEYTPGPLETEQYILQTSTDGKGYLCTDKENLITIFWETNQFNSSQRIANIEDFTQTQIVKLPTILRQMADWLAQNHNHLI